MITINNVINIFVSILCSVLFIGVVISPVIIIAILSTRARLKEAKQIQKNLANGAYGKLDKAKSNRMLMMILSQIILLLSFFVWIGTGLLDISKIFSPLRLVILALIFIIMFILGFALNRTMVKGK